MAWPEKRREINLHTGGSSSLNALPVLVASDPLPIVANGATLSARATLPLPPIVIDLWVRTHFWLGLKTSPLIRLWAKGELRTSDKGSGTGSCLLHRIRHVVHRGLVRRSTCPHCRCPYPCPLKRWIHGSKIVTDN